MHRLLALLILLSIPMSTEAGSVSNSVRALLDNQVAAWNRGDLDAFMTGYWNSPNLTFFSGATSEAGYDATLARYRKKYQQDGQPMGHLEFLTLDIQELGRTAAFVRGEWRLTRGTTPLGGLFTLVVKKFGRAWKIVHDHTAAR